MGFTIEFEDYYIPISLEKTTKEREGIKHFYYGCINCNEKVINLKYCPKCLKETTTKKIYPDGEPEEVGSRDIWDFKRVSISDIDFERITSWKYLKFKENKKKPKASEIAKWKEQLEKIGKSKGLRDLYLDLILNRNAIRFKIVLNGKINDGWIFPYPLIMKKKCLIMGIADGNMVSLPPPENYNDILKMESKVIANDESQRRKQELPKLD